jgi:chromosome segregation ATPase
MSEETTQHLPNNDLSRILARLDSIDSRLSTLEQKVDARSYETKPIWEQALKEIMETRAEVVKVEGRLGNIENEIKDMRRMFRYTFADIARVQEDIEERLDKIEGRESTQ